MVGRVGAMLATVAAIAVLAALVAGCTSDDQGSVGAGSDDGSATGGEASPADGPAGGGAPDEGTADGASADGASVTTLGSGAGSGGGPSVAVGSPSLGPGGNRIVDGVAALGSVDPVDVTLPGIPVLVLPVRSGWLTAEGEAAADGQPAGTPWWYVELDSGQTVVVTRDLDLVDGVTAIAPPTVDGFVDPLPDAVVVEADGLAVALVEPTDRYPHGALGDRIEAAAVEVIGPGADDRTVFGPEPPAVIEGVSAIVADATGDGRPEILVTEADADQGASLALWSPDGELVARSIGIGLGNRWRNQLAIAPVGPDGEVEVIDVRTPHIGGTVQYFRIEGDELVRVASQSGFTSHRFGSRNLDLGAVFDADGDGVLEVVVPVDRRDRIGVLRRLPPGVGSGYDGVEVVEELPLVGRMTTNLGVGPVVTDGTADGTAVGAVDGPAALAVAVGTDESLLRIWPAPAS